ncbi:MAG: hypothetical protein ACYDC0_10940 [Acidimicrobiales bacterium]
MGTNGASRLASDTIRRGRGRPTRLAATIAIGLVAALGSTLLGALPAAAYPLGPGYWMMSTNGSVFHFGQAQYFGQEYGKTLPGPIVAAAPDNFLEGYWMATSKGNVYPFGSSRFYGSLRGKQLPKPVVGMASTTSSLGYWLVLASGGVYNFGDAHWYHSKAGQRLPAPIVGMARTANSHGYWLAGSNGSVYNFGNAAFHGSEAGKLHGTHIVAITSTLDGGGYWLAAANGQVFNFGDAPFYGSKRGAKLPAPITGISVTQNGRGYWITTAKGNVYAFGNAVNYGSIGRPLRAPIFGIFTRPPLALKVDAFVGSASESSNWVHTGFGWRLELHKTGSGTVPAGARVLGVAGILVSQLKTIGYTLSGGACQSDGSYLLLYARTPSGAIVHRSYQCSYGGAGAVKRFNPVAGTTGAPPLSGNDVVTSLDIVNTVDNTTVSLSHILAAGIFVNDYRTYTAAGTVIG